MAVTNTDVEPDDGLDQERWADAVIVVGELLGPEAATVAFVRETEKVLGDYAISLSLQPLWPNPGQQRRLVLQLSKALDKSLRLLLDLSAEYQVAINQMANRGEDLLSRNLNIVDELARIADAAHRFGASYKPKEGPTTNLALEEAVRELVPLLEQQTTGKVTVALNKAKGDPPSLKSPEARALGALVRVVEPALTETTIVNMVVKVRDQPFSSPSHFRAIWDADPANELDACLHPRRHERD